MKENFWHKCWSKDQIGFHQDDVHPMLLNYFNDWAGQGETGVFVPLCGKSLDMHFIAQSHPVLGSELSTIACDDFFKESGIAYQLRNETRYMRYQSAGITLLAGDFFALQSQDVEHCQLIYDRAALIALPTDMRQRYVEKLRALFPSGTQLFLLSLEYPKDELEGPPFSVDETEIGHLFDACPIDKVATLDIEQGKFARRTFNVSWMQEVLYYIEFA